MTKRDQASRTAPGAETGETREMARWLRPVAARLVLFVALFLVVIAAVHGANGLVDSIPVLALPVGLFTAWLCLVVYRWAMRTAERREVLELAPGTGRTDLRNGAVLGLGLFAITVTLIAMSGGYRIDGWGSFGGAITLLGAMAGVAVVEELLFRGIVFRLLEQLAGTWVALAVSSLLFGALHLINPDATVWGALALAIEAGALLGTAYIATRSLWLPIGLHFGWNVAASAIFTTTTSGAEAETEGLFSSAVSGPAAISGGSFGPEASLFAIVVCVIPTVLLLRTARRRGHLHTASSARLLT